MCAGNLWGILSIDYEDPNLAPPVGLLEEDSRNSGNCVRATSDHDRLKQISLDARDLSFGNKTARMQTLADLHVRTLSTIIFLSSGPKRSFVSLFVHE